MYYQHSGRFSLGGLALGLIFGTVGGLILAYAYGKGLVLIPEAHLAAFAAVVFGLLAGTATGVGLVWGHVRNKAMALSAGALTSTMALYLSWPIWLATIFRTNSGRHLNWIKLAKHPASVWSLVQWVNHTGTWGLDSSKATTGWTLWAIWGLEAVTVVGLGMMAAGSRVQIRPYCEACGRWCRSVRPFLLDPVPDVNQLKLQLENKDFRQLESLGPGPKVGDRLIVQLHSCDQCDQFHTLTVTQILVRKKKFGQPNVHSNRIVKQLLVGPAEAQALRQVSEKITQTPTMSQEQARGAAAGGWR